MRITGNVGDINLIELNLESVNTKCIRSQPCVYSMISKRSDLESPNRAVLTFNDSREVDVLIEMLEDFKDFNSNYIGKWKMERTFIND